MDFRDFFNGDFFGNSKKDDNDNKKDEQNSNVNNDNKDTNNMNEKNDDSNIMRYTDDNDDVDDEDDEDYLGCTTLFNIRAKAIKVGGLRLYLALYFMGVQNTPEPKTWKSDQSPDGKSITVYYNKDMSGAIILNFTEQSLHVQRLGSAPSMEYLMEESNLMNGMLDQLDEICGEESGVEEVDRLLRLEEPGDAIQIVREYLAFA